MTIRPATPEAIASAARLLRDGQLVAFPTETVYGLGADATNGRAVAAIYEAKGRPRFNPLIVHVADVASARRFAVLSPLAERLAAAFWPGPLTLVLQKQADCSVSDLATAGLDTVAIRVPSEPVAQALLRAADIPVVAPSANRSGHVSATSAPHVDEDLGGSVAMILDGGPSSHGVESTIVDATGLEPVLLRPGAVTREAIHDAIGVWPSSHTGDSARPNAPGQLESHYAPRSRVRLRAQSAERGEALLAFGRHAPAHDGPMVNLSPSGDLKVAAANLFAALRQLDASGATGIAVMGIPDEGLGAAINDRLRRAAAPR